MAPAPLENGGLGGEQIGYARPVDSHMRALLYVAQQIGRPISEADVRRLAALPDGELHEQSFVEVGQRLGLQVRVVDLKEAQLEELPTPFALSAIDGSAHVVVTGDGTQWTVLDVVAGRHCESGVMVGRVPTGAAVERVQRRGQCGIHVVGVTVVGTRSSPRENVLLGEGQRRR